MRALLLVAVLLASPVAHAQLPGGLTDLGGRPAQLPTAKPNLLVVFWATWCDDCRAKLGGELPELDHRPDLAVVTVNADADAARARAFVDKESVRLPVLRDPEKNLRRELKIFSVPHWALYHREARTREYRLVASEAAFDRSHVIQALEGAGK